jgi:hypothetical protein
MTRRALELLAYAYEAALAGLREDTQAWWVDVLARDPDDSERMSNEPRPMLREYGGSSKTRCCRGSRTEGRSWPTAR